MYHVIYEEYNEYNQFEGSWNLQINSYKKIETARDCVQALRKNNNCRKIRLTQDIK